MERRPVHAERNRPRRPTSLKSAFKQAATRLDVRSAKKGGLRVWACMVRRNSSAQDAWSRKGRLQRSRPTVEDST